ncbi:extensin-like domain-containing protein [Roseibium sp. M-1]
MRKLLILFCLTPFAIQSNATGKPVEPPQAKPLHPQIRSGFVEGIDVPPSKPGASSQSGLPVDAKGEQIREEVQQDCQIEGADFENLEPLFDEPSQEKENVCGIANPVKLTGLRRGKEILSISGPVIISCDFAKMLAQWLRNDVTPSARNLFGQPVATITTGPGYQCRRRNNLPDGKLSEHALGKAIDILGIQLRDGTQISVEEHWGAEAQQGQFLTAIHTSACKRFTTVLGPAADLSHQSHIHLDTGCHGKDCTYIICQ